MKTGAELLAEIRSQEAERARGVLAAREKREQDRQAKAKQEALDGLRPPVPLGERAPVVLCKRCAGQIPVRRGGVTPGTLNKDGFHVDPRVCFEVVNERQKDEAKRRETSLDIG